MEYKIAIGGILTECNQYSSIRIDLDAFKRFDFLQDAQLLESKTGVLGGVFSSLKNSNYCLEPLLFASTSPGGSLTTECYDYLKNGIISRIKALKNLSGLLLPLHGAAVAEKVGDLEGDLLVEIRAIVGHEIPIVVSLDLHAHVTEKMVRNCNALVAWETYPHVDAYTTGQRASQLLIDILNNRINPVMVMSKIPLLHTAINSSTNGNGPFARLMKKLKCHEQNNEMILSTSLIACQPYLDQPDMGSGSIVITNNDEALAKRVANEISNEYWKLRYELEPTLHSPEQAILEGLSRSGEKVLLVETSDCCGGGAAGDSVHVLRKLLELAPESSSLIQVVDPEVATICHKKKINDPVEITLGHKLDNNWGESLTVRAKISSFSEGDFLYKGGIWDGLVGEMGKTVVLRVENIDILVSSFGTYEWLNEQFMSVNLDPDAYKFVVVKNPMNFQNAYSHISLKYILDTPGPTPASCKKIKYTKMSRPFFPLDENIENFVPKVLS